ncbi:L-methionine sulfoximine/L-methionine sulfone acetyltransferase [Thalassocella blandensis]|nr:L-methionine sulfoximine/L-methionine sulfone acetyltransferase [Thalassocella blandensis]
MRKILCNFTEHGEQVLAILNEVIENSTALYDYKARTLQQMQEWFQFKNDHHFPVLGYINDTGKLMGFASFGPFRHFPAYKYTVEHSIYVHQEFRGKGLGKTLLRDIVAAAQERQYHVVIGALDQNNTGSIALHEQMGFTHCGTIHQAAFKFGKWLNLVFYQKILPTPETPHDG